MAAECKSPALESGGHGFVHHPFSPPADLVDTLEQLLCTQRQLPSPAVYCLASGEKMWHGDDAEGKNAGKTDEKEPGRVSLRPRQRPLPVGGSSDEEAEEEEEEESPSPPDTPSASDDDDTSDSSSCTGEVGSRSSSGYSSSESESGDEEVLRCIRDLVRGWALGDEGGAAAALQRDHLPLHLHPERRITLLPRESFLRIETGTDGCTRPPPHASHEYYKRHPGRALGRLGVPPLESGAFLPLPAASRRSVCQACHVDTAPFRPPEVLSESEELLECSRCARAYHRICGDRPASASAGRVWYCEECAADQTTTLITCWLPLYTTASTAAANVEHTTPQEDWQRPPPGTAVFFHSRLPHSAPSGDTSGSALRVSVDLCFLVGAPRRTLVELYRAWQPLAEVFTCLERVHSALLSAEPDDGGDGDPEGELLLVEESERAVFLSAALYRLLRRAAGGGGAAVAERLPEAALRQCRTACLQMVGTVGRNRRKVDGRVSAALRWLDADVLQVEREPTLREPGACLPRCTTAAERLRLVDERCSQALFAFADSRSRSCYRSEAAARLAEALVFAWVDSVEGVGARAGPAAVDELLGAAAPAVRNLLLRADARMPWTEDELRLVAHFIRCATGWVGTSGGAERVVAVLRETDTGAAATLCSQLNRALEVALGGGGAPMATAAFSLGGEPTWDGDGDEKEGAAPVSLEAQVELACCLYLVGATESSSPGLAILWRRLREQLHDREEACLRPLVAHPADADGDEEEEEEEEGGCDHDASPYLDLAQIEGAVGDTRRHLHLHILVAHLWTLSMIATEWRAPALVSPRCV